MKGMLDRNADSSESEEQLPQGPWDGDKWDSHVLLSVIGPNAKGKNTGLRSLFNVWAAWRLMRDLAALPYYQDERVLPIATFRYMHDEVGAKKQIAGYVSVTILFCETR